MSTEGVSVQQAKAMSKEDQEKLINKIEQRARGIEEKYWGCSRAVLIALQENFNLGNSDVVKAASTMPGGIGRMREACGALVGGAMAIGLAYAKGQLEEGRVFLEEEKDVEAMVRAAAFGNKFKEKFGCLRCDDVKAAVRGGSKGYEHFETDDAFEDHKKCAEVTGPAARFAAEIILQPTEVFADEMNVLLGDLRRLREDQKKKGVR